MYETDSHRFVGRAQTGRRSPPGSEIEKGSVRARGRRMTPESAYRPGLPRRNGRGCPADVLEEWC